MRKRNTRPQRYGNERIQSHRKRRKMDQTIPQQMLAKTKKTSRQKYTELSLAAILPICLAIFYLIVTFL